MSPDRRSTLTAVAGLNQIGPFRSWIVLPTFSGDELESADNHFGHVGIDGRFASRDPKVHASILVGVRRDGVIGEDPSLDRVVGRYRCRGSRGFAAEGLRAPKRYAIKLP